MDPEKIKKMPKAEFKSNIMAMNRHNRRRLARLVGKSILPTTNVPIVKTN